MATQTYRVAGVTKQNEDNKDIQSLLKRIAAGYKREGLLDSWDGYTKAEMREVNIGGVEFEDQEINNICRLEADPSNPYDPNAIKVYLIDASGTEHHVGYIKKNETSSVKELLDNKEYFHTVEFTGGRARTIDYDVIEDKDVVEEEELTRGLSIRFKSTKEKTFAPVREVETEVVLSPEDLAKEAKKQKAIEAQKKMEETGKKMQQAGGKMMGCGCLLTILITIPIIIIVLFFL